MIQWVRMFNMPDVKSYFFTCFNPNIEPVYPCIKTTKEVIPTGQKAQGRHHQSVSCRKNSNNVSFFFVHFYISDLDRTETVASERIFFKVPFVCLSALFLPPRTYQGVTQTYPVKEVDLGARWHPETDGHGALRVGGGG